MSDDTRNTLLAILGLVIFNLIGFKYPSIWWIIAIPCGIVSILVLLSLVGVSMFKGVLQIFKIDLTTDFPLHAVLLFFLWLPIIFLIIKFIREH